MSGSSVTLAAVGPRAQAAFTALQWQELEHQALIFKYLKAGLLVPPELLTSIRKSFHSVSARFSHQPGLGYFSYYGKKIDPEPGRCRRTDGKKWRCSKDAYLDSKYCERHKNRGRYRSRKPVESKITSQSLSAVASDVVTGSSSGNRGFQNAPLHSSVTREGLCFGSTVSRLQMEASTCGTRNKEYRCLQGLKPETDEQNFLPVTSGSLKSLGINSTIDSTWRIMKSQIPSNPLPDSRNGAILQSNYPQLQILQDFEPQQQRYLFGWEFGSPGSVKPEHQSFQTLSNQWAESRDVGSYLNDPRANNSSLSTTQLSMSLPMAPDFFARSAHSSNDA